MEHRIGRRIKMNALVELWQSDHKLGDFELLNLGSGGLFLKGVPAVIHEGETCTIKSDMDNPALMHGEHLKVMVVHQSKLGIGLMWAGCNKSFLSRLGRALNRAA